MSEMNEAILRNSVSELRRFGLEMPDAAFDQEGLARLREKFLKCRQTSIWHTLGPMPQQELARLDRTITRMEARRDK